MASRADLSCSRRAKRQPGACTHARIHRLETALLPPRQAGGTFIAAALTLAIQKRVRAPRCDGTDRGSAAATAAPAATRARLTATRTQMRSKEGDKSRRLQGGRLDLLEPRHPDGQLSRPACREGRPSRDIGWRPRPTRPSPPRRPCCSRWRHPTSSLAGAPMFPIPSSRPAPRPHPATLPSHRPHSPLAHTHTNTLALPPSLPGSVTHPHPHALRRPPRRR